VECPSKYDGREAAAGERNPAVAKAIVDGGHEPSGHGYRGDEFHQMSEEEQKEEIRTCVSAIQTLTGERPVGRLNF
jgi:peptidoglycan/xylan/chitin deacetylase (PgdA/CDA1 family)